MPLDLYTLYKMTRTEEIFEMIKGLPEIELTELLEMVHEHSCKNRMEHVFYKLYDFEADEDYQDMVHQHRVYGQLISNVSAEIDRWKMANKPSDERMILTLTNIEEILL